MKIETFETRILRPREGYWLTNGETYSKHVVLGKEARINKWKEITNEEYLKIYENQQESLESRA